MSIYCTEIGEMDCGCTEHYGRMRLGCTASGHRIAHRKWKESKLQPSTAGPGNMLSVFPFPVGHPMSAGCIKIYFFWPRSLPHCPPTILESFTHMSSDMCEIINDQVGKSAVLSYQSLARYRSLGFDDEITLHLQFRQHCPDTCCSRIHRGRATTQRHCARRWRRWGQGKCSVRSRGCSEKSM